MSQTSRKNENVLSSNSAVLVNARVFITFLSIDDRKLRDDANLSAVFLANGLTKVHALQVDRRGIAS